jgi:sugar/nucleoside kinase (ribokinase family)
MAIRIVVAGEIYLDQVFTGFSAWPQPGEEAFATFLTREVGGGAPQTAAGLARLGRDVTLVGPVGNEDWVRARLKQLGLGTEALYQHPSEPTGTTVAVSMPGERTFFTYRGANSDVEAALLNLPEADHLHVAAACNCELLRLLCRRAKTVSVDAGWHPEWLRDPSVQESLRSASWFFPNQIEAAAMTGESEPSEMLKRFDELGIRAAVKLGPSGSAASLDGCFIQVPSIDVEPVDTTGAGDCFDAGFLDAWLRGESLDVCLQAGNICGALSTTTAGGMNGFPTREEMNKWRSKLP